MRSFVVTLTVCSSYRLKPLFSGAVDVLAIIYHRAGRSAHRSNIETIRYHERIRLLPEASRRGRYRCYGAEDVARLGFVRRSRELGFSIREVRALLDLASGGHASCAHARDLAAVHLSGVRSRIADLQRMERVLSNTVIACDAGDELSCPLIDTLTGN